MTALSSFLQAIRDDPLDDTPRLIFADWLQEQTNPLLASRGELLGVQCQLEPLWHSRHTGRLRRLELANNALTDVSVARLLDSPLLQLLLFLD